VNIPSSFALIGFLVLPAGVGAQCQPAQIDAHLVQGDRRAALKYSEVCVATYKAAAPTGKDALTASEGTTVFLLAYHLCARAQVEAMLGQQEDSAKSIKEAEQLQDDWPGWFGSPLILWRPVIEITKGFALEKAGKIEEAKRWYLDHPSEYTQARLGVLALPFSADEAKQYAQEVLKDHPKNPTAHAVLGSVFEKSGNKSEALAEFRTSLEDMSQDELKNEFMPVVVAESGAVKLAIARLQSR
jgi:tetratricopeptide (TPR) repeat protein